MTAANERRVRQGGLMRCCLGTIAEADHETEVGDTLSCKFESGPNVCQMIVAVDGVWEWDHP